LLQNVFEFSLGAMMSAVGATTVLSLRVSVATLVRVLFENPRTGEMMLALERKATFHPGYRRRVVGVKSQPFGGAIRIRDPLKMRDLIGDFRFDSERSRSEQDFRIFIQPSNWEIVREFCVQHFSQVDSPVLETDPERELVEEFFDTLAINLQPDQYTLIPIATVLEDDPVPTENIHAEGYLTVRVYRIFEACILDYSLAYTMMNNTSISNQELTRLALEHAQNGGVGRANAILALPMKPIKEMYLAKSPQERCGPIMFDGNRLDETIPVLLDGITVPKYRRL
jgi:hypothetical protein